MKKKFTIYLSADVIEMLKIKAVKEKTSSSQLIENAVTFLYKNSGQQFTK